jgi:bacterioferritin-associated ferredoxin
VLVCHCKVVSDRDVRAAIGAGARDEFDVADACGAGSICGGCVPAVTALLAESGCAAGCPIPGLRASRVPAGAEPVVR